MYGNVGYYQKVAVNVHKLGCYAAVLPAHKHAARNGERAIEPGGHERAAVAFGCKLHIMRAGLFRIILYLKGW